jgi:hypothetical protein
MLQEKKELISRQDILFKINVIRIMKTFFTACRKHINERKRFYKHWF